MKKLLLAAFLLAGTFLTQAQTKFGVKAGADLATVKMDLGPFGSASETYTGFYVGGFVSLGFSDSMALQPEVLYVALPDDASYISVPVMGKYTFAQKFSVLAGPSFNYFLNAEDDEFKVNVDFGAAYSFTEHIEANAKYSVGFGDVAVSGLFLGGAYKF